MFDTSTYSRKLLIRVQITRFYYSMLPIRLDHLEVIWGEGGLWSTYNTMIISVGSCLWLNLLIYILKIIILSTQKCSSFLNCFKVDDCKFINFFFIKKKMKCSSIFSCDINRYYYCYKQITLHGSIFVVSNIFFQFCTIQVLEYYVSYGRISESEVHRTIAKL